VARALPIERLVLGGGTPPEAVRTALAALPTPERLRRGQGWSRAGVRFEALSEEDPALTENDASLVLRVEHGATAFLFPGDLEGAGEAALLAASGGRLRVDVVKVAHHGSRTSSGAAFVAATRPRFAVAELGAGNRYGFPHPEAVSAWQGVGATFLRTDDGAVRLLSDGRTVVRADPAGALGLEGLLPP